MELPGAKLHLQHNSQQQEQRACVWRAGFTHQRTDTGKKLHCEEIRAILKATGKELATNDMRIESQ